MSVYKTQDNELFNAVSNLLPLERHHRDGIVAITMASFLLYILTMALVEVQCFRTPLPFGTGFQGATQDDDLSVQGIFHLLGEAFKYAFWTNDSLLEPEIEGNTKLAELANIKKVLEQLVMIGKSRMMAMKNYGEKLQCLPGMPGWPGCNFLLKIN